VSNLILIYISLLVPLYAMHTGENYVE